MITILKEFLITYKGKDATQQLVIDDDVRIGEGCLKCIYHGWNPTCYVDPDCVTLHGCNRFDDSYFRIKE